VSNARTLSTLAVRRLIFESVSHTRFVFLVRSFVLRIPLLRSTYINYINFDVELLRPGCAGIPTFNYVRRTQTTGAEAAHARPAPSLSIFSGSSSRSLCSSSVSSLLSFVCLPFVPQVMKFRVTILLMFIAACMFLVACGVRLWRRVADKRRLELEVAASRGRPSAEVAELHHQLPLSTRFRLFLQTDEWIDASQRLQHALLILLSIFYLRLSILQFKAFMCTTAPDPLASTASDAAQTESLYLTEDMQTLCYRGSHRVTVAFVILLFLFYTAGFPLFCFVLLMRAFANKRTPGVLGWLWVHIPLMRGDGSQAVVRNRGSVIAPPSAASSLSHAAVIRALLRSRENTYGYLFFSYRPSHFAMCMLVFIVQVCVAAITVFVSDDSPLLKLFLFGLLWGSQTMLIAIELPFEAWPANVRKVLFGLVSLVSAKRAASQ
jgi:hypothetical protein